MSGGEESACHQLARPGDAQRRAPELPKRIGHRLVG
jgi:hypothetical protein